MHQRKEIWVGSGSLHSTYSWSLGPEGVNLDVRCPIVPSRKWKLGDFQRLVQSLPVQPRVEAELEPRLSASKSLALFNPAPDAEVPLAGGGTGQQGDLGVPRDGAEQGGSLLGARAMVFPPDPQPSGCQPASVELLQAHPFWFPQRKSKQAGE